MRRRARRQVLGVVGLLLLTASPFAAVGAWRARPEPVVRPTWPTLTAVVHVGADGGPIAVGLLDPVSPALAVELDPDVVLDVPEVGALRARTLYGIEGASLVARGLAALLGTDVEAWMVVDRNGVVGSNFDAPGAAAAAEALTEASVHEVRGTTAVRSRESFEQVAADDVRALLNRTARGMSAIEAEIASRYKRWATIVIADAGAGRAAVRSVISTLRARGFRYVARGQYRGPAVEATVASYFVDEDLATYLLAFLDIDGLVRLHGRRTDGPTDVILALGKQLGRDRVGRD